MLRLAILSFVLGVVPFLAGCASCGLERCVNCCCPDAKKGPKTLLEWKVCKGEEDKKKDEEKDSKNGEKNGEKKDTTEEKKPNGDAKASESADAKKNGSDNGKKEEPKANGKEEEPEEDEIVTDRPDFTEASTTVGKGRIQLETGYTYIRDGANGSRLTAHSYPEALLRIGMFAEWFELRLGQNFANERVTLPNGRVESVSGAEDLYLGVKLGLTEQQKCFPEMAFVLQMTVPSGADVFSADEVLPGFNWLYGWDIIKDCLSAGGSTQANRSHGALLIPIPHDPGTPQESITGIHSFLELAQSFTVNYTLTKKLGAYTEWFAFFPHSSLDPEVGPEHYLNGGFTYKITPLTQYDIRAGVGLNRRADDFFAGTGISFKY